MTLTTQQINQIARATRGAWAGAQTVIFLDGQEIKVEQAASATDCNAADFGSGWVYPILRTDRQLTRREVRDRLAERI